MDVVPIEAISAPSSSSSLLPHQRMASKRKLIADPNVDHQHHDDDEGGSQIFIECVSGSSNSSSGGPEDLSKILSLEQVLQVAKPENYCCICQFCDEWIEIDEIKLKNHAMKHENDERRRVVSEKNFSNNSNSNDTGLKAIESSSSSFSQQQNQLRETVITCTSPSSEIFLPDGASRSHSVDSNDSGVALSVSSDFEYAGKSGGGSGGGGGCGKIKVARTSSGEGNGRNDEPFVVEQSPQSAFAMTNNNNIIQRQYPHHYGGGGGGGDNFGQSGGQQPKFKIPHINHQTNNNNMPNNYSINSNNDTRYGMIHPDQRSHHHNNNSVIPTPSSSMMSQAHAYNHPSAHVNYQPNNYSSYNNSRSTPAVNQFGSSCHYIHQPQPQPQPPHHHHHHHQPGASTPHHPPMSQGTPVTMTKFHYTGPPGYPDHRHPHHQNRQPVSANYHLQQQQQAGHHQRQQYSHLPNSSSTFPPQHPPPPPYSENMTMRTTSTPAAAVSSSSQAQNLKMHNNNNSMSNGNSSSSSGTSNIKYVCSLCTSEFNSPAMLITHQGSFHRIHPKRVSKSCSICHRIYTSNHGLSSHMAKCHRDGSNPSSTSSSLVPD